MFQRFLSLALLIIIFFLLFDRLDAQEEEGEIIIISERVCEVIDLKERNKYNLFLDIKGFQSAVVLKLSNGSYVLKVTYMDETTGEKKLKRISQMESQIKRIREHIDHFEKKQAEKYQFEKEPPSKQKTNYCLNAGLGTIIDEDYADIVGMFSIEGYKYFGFEVIEIIGVEVRDEDVVISGNLSLNFLNETRFIPFATIGLGQCLHKDLFLNFGGGIKIRLTEKLGIRTEYRYWVSSLQTAAGFIFGGISYFFHP